MPYIKAQPFKPQFEDVDGNTLTLGTIEFFLWNTTTPTPYYTDSTGTPGGTSLTLNLLGKPNNDIFWDSLITYKIVTKDRFGTVIDTLGPYSVPLDGTSLSNTSNPALGDALIGVKLTLANSIAETQHDLNERFIFFEDFGAKGAPADDTVAINNAMQAAYTARKPIRMLSKTYMVRESSPGSTYCILNPGVAMYGDSCEFSVIAPLSTTPNTADIMRIEPPANGILDLLLHQDYMIYPGLSGTKYGKRSIFVNVGVVSNATAFSMERVYCAPGNDYSMEWYTDRAVNGQGVPANCEFHDCEFWEGTKFTNAGDSVSIRKCVLRSSAGSGRIGVNFQAVYQGAAAAACLNLEDNNVDCDGGFAYILAGTNFTINGNNVELSTGSPAAIINIDGTTVNCAWGEITHNLITPLNVSNPTSLILINNAAGTLVEHNRMQSGPTVANGIYITANASDTIVGINEIGTTITAPVTDLGQGTRGVTKQVTLVNGFGNLGTGYAAAAVTKSRDGVITFNGYVTCPNPSNNIVMTTLPVGFRPASAQRLNVGSDVGGAITTSVVDISAVGVVTFFTAGTPGHAYFSVQFPSDSNVIGNV